MTFSRHNIFSKIKDSDAYYIVNPLSGNADILTPEKAREIIEETYTDIDEYRAKGYLVDEKEETRLFRKRYADFLDSRDTDEMQIFFVPWYSCNFACSYCYQEGYDNAPALPGDDVIDAFFTHVREEFAGRKKYLTIFGGEPLLPGEGRARVIGRLMEKAKDEGMGVALVTNGYHLTEYLDLFARLRPREIQVTLDGVATMHDARRPLKGGGGTFERIVAGIDGALALDIPVNLRVVIDRQNIGELPALARFAIEKGWTKHPAFKTQLGRNYELHYCQSDRDKLFSRLELYGEIYRLVGAHPHILEFHRPAFSIAKFLFENGTLPDPLFDACPGTKTEWAFDHTGAIYSCTATVGKPGESLGTFYPVKKLETERIAEWADRDVTSIRECASCSLQLACGGGCASVAFNATGRIDAPDCRPVRELLELGISTYFKKSLT